MFERFSLASGAFALILTMSAGCGSGGSNYAPTPAKPVSESKFKPGDELSMFPAKVGNQWTYTMESTQTVPGKGTGNAKGEVTLKVVGVTPTEGGNVIEIDVIGDSNDPKATGPKSVSHQVWEVNSKGIYQRSVGTPAVVFEPYSPTLLFPPDPERKFSWKGRGPTPLSESGEQSLDSKILAGQSVDTANDQIWAIPVESKGTFKTPKAKGLVASTAYWAPGIGLVRFRQEVAVGDTNAVMTMKLKTKSLQ